MNTNSEMFAYCATAFFVLMGWGLIQFGAPPVKVLTIAALFFAGASQFIAQGMTMKAYRMAQACVVTAGLLFILAIAAYFVTMHGN